jgi:hypothetical protein
MPSAHKGWRVTQIHTGNTAANVKGCFAVGRNQSPNFVGDSVNAMLDILLLMIADGTNNVNVTVTGAPTP